jgi:hypothetical protein
MSQEGKLEVLTNEQLRTGGDSTAAGAPDVGHGDLQMAADELQQDGFPSS